MNENANLLAAMYLALNQIQSMKDKVDPQAFELLNKAGHEALSSARHFLDACEVILDSFTSESLSDEIDLTDDAPTETSDDRDNIVPLNTREA